MWAATVQQWKITMTGVGGLALNLMALPMVILFAWIAQKNADISVLTYLMVGAPLMTIWNGGVFRVGWSLNGEIFSRTMDFVFTSRTPMLVVLAGKALAQMLYGIPAAIIAFGAMFAIVRTLPEVASPALLAVSILITIAAITITSLVFAPIMVLMGGRAGFFNAILPFGAVMGGFLFPIDRLPAFFEVVAHFLPTSWAMKGVWLSIQGAESAWDVISMWLMCILASVFIFVVTYLLFKVVEKRIRITGVLGTY